MMSKASSDEIMHLFGADVVSLHGPLKQFADEIGMTTFVDMLQTGDSVLEAEWKFDVASQHELLDIQKLMVTTNRALQRFAAKPLKVLIYSFWAEETIAQGHEATSWVPYSRDGDCAAGPILPGSHRNFVQGQNAEDRPGAQRASARRAYAKFWGIRRPLTVRAVHEYTVGCVLGG